MNDLDIKSTAIRRWIPYRTRFNNKNTSPENNGDKTALFLETKPPMERILEIFAVEH